MSIVPNGFVSESRMASGMDPVVAHQDWASSDAYAIGPRVAHRKVVYADSEAAWDTVDALRAADPRHTAATVVDLRAEAAFRYGASAGDDTAVTREFAMPTAVEAGAFDTAVRPASSWTGPGAMFARSSAPLGALGAESPRYRWSDPAAERERASVASPDADARAIDDWGRRIGGLVHDSKLKTDRVRSVISQSRRTTATTHW